MKQVFVQLLLIFAVAGVTVRAAYADDSYVELPNLQLSNSKLMRQAARGRGAWTSPVTYDTTFIGYDATHATGPGNYWNLWAHSTTNSATGVSCWNFEDLTNPRLHGDSLMGWWPTNDRAAVLGTALTNDHDYVYSCLDFGNETSYKIPGTNERTWGVIGAWHADPGRFAGTGVTWTPMSGSKSAWCGLRQHHDSSVIDAQTRNPYNSDCADFIVQNSAPTVKNFPGYVRAWDQMLYRDITPVEGQPLTLSFLYRTWMSTEYSAGAGRRGWFHGDPLSTANGNFISSFTQLGPIDSFSVYIGIPVEDDAVTLSTGAVAPVFDPQRRWFSEVIKLWDGPTAPYYEILGKTGINPADTTGYNTFSAVIPWATIRTIAHSPLNAAHSVAALGNVRLVFRVKTNNTGDDLTSSTWGELGGRGAAQVDDVTVQWGAAAATVIGDFEGNEGDANNVNNAIGASPVTYWKSTGKPPALYFHARSLMGLAWNDLCGPVGAETRTCNMQGNVLDAGNDPTEMIGDNTYEAGKNGIYGILSPTIDLSSTGTSLFNSQGLDSTLAVGSDDYYVQFDIYTADFALYTGAMYFYGCASYPNRSVGNGTETWGDVVTSPSVYYDSNPQCHTNLLPFKARNMVHTSRASGGPDSMRVWLGIYNFPLRFGATTAANPTDGGYMDNVSFLIVNKTGANRVGPISSDIWQWFVDAFPVASTVTLGAGTFASSLDTCGALVKGALNIAQHHATNGLGGTRLDVLADTIVVAAPDLSAAAGDTNSLNIRVDMVFRILPGPGNYRSNLGDVNPAYPPVAGMKLLRRPDVRNASASCLVNASDPTDSSFWAAYIRNPGEYSSPSPHPRGEWDNLTWNSARLDTAETNRFPTHDLTSAFPVRPGSWQSTLHESDPHYGVLGIARPRCFVIDTTQFTNLQNTNIVCGSAPAWLSPEVPGTTPPRSRTGWDGAVTTIEGTKVIPDGLLTPGSHVQYFFRKSQVFGRQGYEMDPDTSTISPQVSEGNFDGHRWQQFSVLPDRWKDTRFGGPGMTCTLYLDYDDRRGDELVWASVMDSLCGTAPVKYGAHNGWHKAGRASLDKNYNANLQAGTFVYKNAQPGTTWDMWSARATESASSVGARLGARFAPRGTGLLAGHDAAVAPTTLMLRQFYSSIVLLSGDLNTSVLGPGLDIPEDDARILGEFLSEEGGLLGKPRSLFAAGSGFVESESMDPAHATWLANQLGVSLVSNSYVALSSNTAACSDITSTSVISTTDIFGTGLSCNWPTNVVGYNPLKTGAQDVSYYTNTGAGPYAAAVYHAPNPLVPAENYVTLVDGFDVADLWSRYCAYGIGRLIYFSDLKSKITGSVCSSWAHFCGPVDVPQSAAGIANYLKVGNSAARSGNATLHFGVATTGRVRVRLYDVTGRLVRTLADRTFPGGQAQVLRWDGLDNSGNAAARGVYFARVDYAAGAAINGRVVFLR